MLVDKKLIMRVVIFNLLNLVTMASSTFNPGLKRKRLTNRLDISRVMQPVQNFRATLQSLLITHLPNESIHHTKIMDKLSHKQSLLVWPLYVILQGVCSADDLTNPREDLLQAAGKIVADL